MIVIAALWALWLIFWMVAALRTKPTRAWESGWSRLSYHVPLVLGAVALAVPNFLGEALEGVFVPQSPIWLWIGIVLVVVGLGFAVAARLWLGGNWSGTVTIKQGHELIRSGPYALVRHPIYSGMLLALIGSALGVGKLRALIGLVLIVVSFLRKVSIEERFMAARFGEAYARYSAEVPALVPFVV